MINKEIIQALKLMNLPIFYITKATNDTTTEEYITFNYLENPNSYVDMQEEKTEFNILINIYCSNKNIVNYREQAKELLKESGFIKQNIPSSFYNDELKLYVIALNYKYYKYNY